MNQATFNVTGMTCGHCVSSVTEEIEQIPGVSDVDVDLATGAVTITSDDPIAEDDVRKAVAEAGYALAGA